MSLILSDKGRVPQQEVNYDRDSGFRVVFQLQRDDSLLWCFKKDLIVAAFHKKKRKSCSLQHLKASLIYGVTANHSNLMFLKNALRNLHSSVPRHKF